MTDTANPLDGWLDYAPARLQELPPHLQKGLQVYIEDGHVPGGGLQRIIANAPVAECGPYLDEVSFAGLPKILAFLHNFAPGQCWGSRDKLLAWAKDGGLRAYAQSRGAKP